MLCMLKPFDRYIGQIKRKFWFGLFGAHSICSKKNPHQTAWVTIFPSLRFPGDRSWAKRAREVQSSIQVPCLKAKQNPPGSVLAQIFGEFFLRKKRKCWKETGVTRNLVEVGKLGFWLTCSCWTCLSPSKTCQSLDSFFVRGSQQRNGH